MNQPLSPNTQAILLLTAPLLVGRSQPRVRPLSPGTYAELAGLLRKLGRQPADFLTDQAEELIRECRVVAEAEQLRALLARGFQLGQALERWRSRAIWVISRADARYPRRLKARLNGVAPPVLYGCGELSLLDTGGLAVVGSREIDTWLVEYTQQIGELAARAHKTVVSGGARGVDQTAMRGGLEGGGSAVGVLADDLEAAALRRENRAPLLEGRLVLISPYDPGAGFNVGHAMQRNKLIYALADAALVVNAAAHKGGTWTGAIEQLDHLRFGPVYVRSTGTPSEGLDLLRQRGAEPWPNPLSPEALVAALVPPARRQSGGEQIELPLAEARLPAKLGYA